jgi:glycosyltransferase involved in cell wall biosynthesis
MKIAIIGTRGIPNHYGGFEQFAEYLSVGLVKMGHEITVYNSHDHPFQESTWNGVNIIHCKDPEHKIGTVGQFIYDLNCILDSRKRNFDCIVQLGYTSSSIWSRFFPKKATILTNMDGLEWKRSKYSKPVQRFLKYAEKLAIRHSDVLISDSLGIQAYLKEKYSKDSTYIPYGADVFSNPDKSILAEYDLDEYGYNMLIARMEPENNIETILDGVVQAKSTAPFLVIGNTSTKLGKALVDKFSDHKNIQFLGAIYNMDTLNNLRHYSNIYFHGHSVGGTNPSLLEAMASSSLICANDNNFNRSILNEQALYFLTSNDVSEILKITHRNESHNEILNKNIDAIATTFAWSNIIEQYEATIVKSKGN